MRPDCPREPPSDSCLSLQGLGQLLARGAPGSRVAEVWQAVAPCPDQCGRFDQWGGWSGAWNCRTEQLWENPSVRAVRIAPLVGGQGLLVWGPEPEVAARQLSRPASCGPFQKVSVTAGQTLLVSEAVAGALGFPCQLAPPDHQASGDRPLDTAPEVSSRRPSSDLPAFPRGSPVAS